MIPTVCFSVVAVLCLGADSALSQHLGFPQFGLGYPGMGSLGPFGNPFMGQQQQHQQDVMTCINSDPQDPTSFIRMTITSHNPMGAQSPFFMTNGLSDEAPRDWYINGYYKPSTLQPVSGTFQMVVTQFGRVRDGCSGSALGPAVTSSLQALNPFATNGVIKPAGLLQSPLMVTQGGLTIYSSMIHGVSKRQLLGSGMAVCPQYNTNGECYGIVLQCCTIAEDQMPSSEVYITPTSQQNQLGAFAGGVGLPAVGMTAGVGGVGGFGGSVPFQINSGNGLSFTDPNAVLAASNEGNSREQSSAESGSSAETTSAETTTPSLF